ncbi:type IV pilus modification protein PilV [Legionella sp. MW5194]|uniref:type IV pilus modification protein PilV n=1 Tax=Legionella sp. MW5194 TaxID=2662448 RepID=UPI00193E2B6F|nr:type IV pilus modification protein PilV [Legionella sp. MW5194]QRN04310.1 type IV pilus modification protein PilV [Legionella sp. MW5194]
MKHWASQQKGFSLIEVLVSSFVLALGLLGIASLQMNAIRYNQTAQLRSIAIAQAGNMVDRMMANSAGIQSGAYNNISGTPSLPNCTTCSAGQIAQRDVHIWNSTNSTLLPQGQGTITRNGNQFTVIMRWDNERTGVNGTGCSGDADVDLTCLIMEVEL